MGILFFDILFLEIRVVLQEAVQMLKSESYLKAPQNRSPSLGFSSISTLRAVEPDINFSPHMFQIRKTASIILLFPFIFLLWFDEEIDEPEIKTILFQVEKPIFDSLFDAKVGNKRIVSFLILFLHSE